MSTKPRKPTGSFVCDAMGGSVLQQTPRVSDMMGYERSPNPMANHTSKTNFIGDSVMPEGPRAVAVSETGEKHSILLDEEILRTRMSHVTSPMSVTPTPTPTSTAALPPTAVASFTTKTNFNPIAIEKPRLNSTKRSKATRRYINQKPRPVFTPRNRTTTPRAASRERPAPMHINFNAQTQTDLPKTCPQPQPPPPARQSSHPHIYHHQQQHQQLQHQQLHGNQQLHHHPVSSLPVPLPRRYIRESIGDRLAESPRIQPLRVLPLPRNKKFKPKDFSELRSIASALTLITVVSWLFSTFFELEGFFEIIGELMQSLQNWFTRREQPMTKAQLLVEYLRSWWP